MTSSWHHLLLRLSAIRERCVVLTFNASPLWTDAVAAPAAAHATGLSPYQRAAAAAAAQKARLWFS